MRKIVHKVFWAWEFEKEEKWLNEMSEKGLAIVAIDFCKYTFDESNPSEYIVRLELLENLPTSAEGQQYIKFVEETGAEYLGSITRWAYFRKKTTDGEFNIYSDNASRVKHLNRILVIIGAVAVLNIFLGIMNLGTHLKNVTTAGAVPAMLSLSLGLFLACGFLQIFLKRRKLKQQQSLFE